MQLFGDNGIVKNSQIASLMSRFASYKEELEMNVLDDTGVYASGKKIKQYIPSMDEKDIEKFVIIKSELVYIDSNEHELRAAQNLKLGGVNGETSDSAAAVKEIQSIIGGVVELNNKYADKVPTDDSQLLNEPEHTNNANGLIGIRLFDRNTLNMQNHTWNILDEYNSNNEKTARYGTGYYWLKKGITYTIDGDIIEFKNDYVVDYTKNEYIVLSGRAVNWNENSTLAVAQGLALNVDPMSLDDGEWRQNTTDTNFYDFYVKNPITEEWTNTGIQKTGDVEYNSLTKSLKFNESSNNTSGEGGYIKLMKSGVDFSNGFTFEMYMNLSRLAYTNSYGYSGGLFLRIKYLGFDRFQAMRFLGFGSGNVLCKFGDGNEWYYGENMSTDGANIYCNNGVGYNINEDVYLTISYIVGNESNKAMLSDYDYMKNKGLDKLNYYINGQLYGWTYYPSSSYEDGAKSWNNDDCPFFIGVCEWNSNSGLYFLKGNVHTTRLYTIPINDEEVKLNYDTTLRYRSSF